MISRPKIYNFCDTYVIFISLIISHLKIKIAIYYTFGIMVNSKIDITFLGFCSVLILYLHLYLYQIIEIDFSMFCSKYRKTAKID